MVVYNFGQSHRTTRSSSERSFWSVRQCGKRQELDESYSMVDKSEVIDEKKPDAREQWVISIKDVMEKTRLRIHNDTTRWESICIYRVPHYFQQHDKKSYVPHTVSLGPYHHGKEHLMPMEFHKWCAVNMILKRTEQPIEMYFDAIKELEERARACYQGFIDLSSTKFIQMLILDGCFVLELFRGTIQGFEKIGYTPNDPVFAMRGMMHSIQRDMIMLENQLPLFVLDQLEDIQLNTPTQTDIVPAEVAVQFFKRLMPTSEELNNSDLKTLISSDELHCLDVFRRSLFQTLHSSSELDQGTMIKVDKQQQHLIHCVSELREAGSKSMFSNLMAFEQCHIKSSNHIASFIVFMDNLINTSEDVRYLHYCGIIEHWLGSDQEVAELFNKLCKVVFDPVDSYLCKLSGEINCYYSQKWNTWRAMLKHNYFNNPLAIVSLCAAVILLVLTFSQSFFAVYAYYKPPS